MQKKYFIYHSKDLDGVACAALPMRYMQGEWEYIPFDYKDDCAPIHAIPDGSEVVMADVSLPYAEMEALAKRTQLTWIDHHKTAYEELEELKPLVQIVYSPKIAACELVLRWLENKLQATIGENTAKTIEILGKYDSWRQDEYWENATLPIQYGFRQMVGLSPRELADCMAEEGILSKAAMIGGVILDYHCQQIEQIMQGAFPCTLIAVQLRIKALAVNAAGLSSDTLRILDIDKDVVLVQFHYTAEGLWKLSLRSRGPEVDGIAKLYGGGGHPLASGFHASRMDEEKYGGLMGHQLRFTMPDGKILILKR